MRLISSLGKLSSLTFKNCNFVSSPISFDALPLPKLMELNLQHSNINEATLTPLINAISHTRSSGTSRPLIVNLTECEIPASILTSLRDDDHQNVEFIHEYYAQERLANA
jgi:hypothetical protein